MPIKYFFLLVLSSICILSCGGSDNGQDTQDNFNRKAMVESWADVHIIPGYQNFKHESETLVSLVQTFSIETNQDHFQAVRIQFRNIYLQWQNIAQYDIGKAEQLSFRSFINTYPTDVEFIENEILSKNLDINLDLISTISVQGLPAIDYLLFGTGETDEEVLSKYQGVNGQNYLSFLQKVCSRIDELTGEIIADWQDGFRDSFVNNTGNSATSSVDKLVNDFIYYYERNLRAGKVGIPAGQFSDNILPTHVEAVFHKNLNRDLLLSALNASESFFKGSVYGKNGPSLRSYLDYLDEIKSSETLLSKAILDQYEVARNLILTLPEEMQDQLTGNDPFKMLEVYDELQKLVVLFKIDMLQAIGVNVDFVDTDGD